MNGTEHERAIALAAENDIETLSAADSSWLRAHLEACSDCAALAGALGLTQQALASIPVTASDALVAATKARVRVRALELREAAARSALIGLSVAIAATISSATLYFAWPLVTWIETRLDVPAFIAEPGFVITWFVPTAIAAAVLVGVRGRAVASAIQAERR